MYVSARAERVLGFVSILYRSIGLELPRYQREYIQRLYGTIDEDGYRQFRWTFLSVPRKNAKSTLVAALAIYHLVFDGEDNPKIFIAATSLDQTGETFEIIARMVDANPSLYKSIVVHNTQHKKQATLYDLEDKQVGYIKSLTRGGSKEGKNPSVVLFDELCDWAEKDRKLWASMTKGSLARKQPLFIVTTTAGEQNHGLCFEQYQYAKRVASGETVNRMYYPYIIEADPANWSDPEEWKRVNPLVAEGFIPFKNVEAEFLLAQVSEDELKSFQRKRLNMWVGLSSAYLDINKWKEQDEEIDDSHLMGLSCVASFDLSRNKDFTCLMLTFAEPIGRHTKYYCLPFFWLPEEGLKQRQDLDGMPYDVWVQKKLLYLSPGATIDHHLLLDKLKELSATYSISEVAYDSHLSDYLTTDLVDAGYTVGEFRQGWKSMTIPMRELQTLVLNKLIVHGNNPILTWQAGQLQARIVDDTGTNIKPFRRNPKIKIDGMVSLIMGIGTLMRHESEPPQRESSYLMLMDSQDESRASL